MDDHPYIENHRYLKEAFFCLPLPSGRVAVLTPRRDLFQIVETWEEAKQIGPLAEQHGRSKMDIDLGPRSGSGSSIKLEIKL
jgi:hypothetical protein